MSVPPGRCKYRQHDAINRGSSNGTLAVKPRATQTYHTRQDGRVGTVQEPCALVSAPRSTPHVSRRTVYDNQPMALPQEVRKLLPRRTNASRHSHKDNHKVACITRKRKTKRQMDKEAEKTWYSTTGVVDEQPDMSAK